MERIDSITHILNEFNSHSLNDLSNSQLMDRFETKYLLPVEQVPELLEAMQSLTTLLVVEGQQVSLYQNTYFDTDGLNYYLDHQTGALKRYKIRARTYVNQNTSYLEVKQKTHSRIEKKRILIPELSADTISSNASFLLKSGILNPSQLIQTQECSYSRIALASESTAERLSIDFNLCYRDKEGSEHINLKNLAVIELKQKRYSASSKLCQAILKKHIQPSSFSKYCIGISLMHARWQKSNRFKETYLELPKFTEVVKGV